MFATDQYSLIDFGNGRRLERFNGLILDRLCPAAEVVVPAFPKIWKTADARFCLSGEKTSQKSLGERGVWQPLSDRGRQYFEVIRTIEGARSQNSNDSEKLSESLDVFSESSLNESLNEPFNEPTRTFCGAPWTLRYDLADEIIHIPSKNVESSAFPATDFGSEKTERATDALETSTPCQGGVSSKKAAFWLELKGSPFGHLGVFPEQADNWSRLYRICREGGRLLRRPMKVLNLFGYTGGSSLAAAVAQADVTHIDAAKNILQQVKRNALLTSEQLFGTENSLTLRTMAEDASKFVRRELKRRNFYDGVILDPPTYGHGAKGEVWRLSRDLPKLLQDCVALLNDAVPFLLLTCHSQGFDEKKLVHLANEALLTRFSARECQKFHLHARPIFLRSEQHQRLSAGYQLWMTAQF